jgi:catalase
LVREVMDDAQRERLVHNVVLHVCDGVKEPVLSRVFEYWRNIDPEIGKRIEEGVRANRSP